MGIFSKINFGLSKTRNKMAGAIDDMLDSFDSFEDDLYTELEEILVMSDVGVKTAVEVVEELKRRVASEKIKKTSEVKKELQNIIADMLYGGEDMGLITLPSVILVLGVNGAGKTTSIGKMAAMYKAEGKKVILGAADTFRAAAIDQLDVWAQRAGVDIIKHKEGADPAAVVYDTIQAGVARDCDIIICDTAGRLHNKKNLMDELNKIYRVVDKELPYADREILLVLDATTGQNGVNQAREFMQVAELTGIILTKLDGTARGGVVLTIKNELKLPVKFIGVGEGIDDLQPFDPAAFAASLFENAQERSDENENSLEDLVNSDDYKNFTPTESEPDGLETVKALFAEAFGDGEGEDEQPSVGQSAEGQTHTSDEEKGQEEAEKAQPQAAQGESESQKDGDKSEVAEIEGASEDVPQKGESGKNEGESPAQIGVNGDEKAEKVNEKISEDSASAGPEKVEEIAAASEKTEETEADTAETEKAADEATIPEETADEEASEDNTSAGKADASADNADTSPEAPQAQSKETEKEPEKKKRRGLFGLFGRHS